MIDSALDMRKLAKLTTQKNDKIHRTFSLLLKEPATDNIKYEDYVFTFIDNPEIPPDNNEFEVQSEILKWNKE